MNRIIPENELKEILLSVKIPGRYVGGEFGTIEGFKPEDYKVAICFPDLYEIGMSNQAIKILYREFNDIEGVSCERVFAPDSDFEVQLKKNNKRLYTLESGLVLNDLDLLGISIGYELSATTILSILESGGIPVYSNDRKETDPLVIAGGPAITNPLPFAGFFDGVFLGEAENNFGLTLMKLRDLKKSGESRDDALNIINQNENIWTFKKHKTGKKAKRALWNGFSISHLENLPISNIATIQDNGIIEIMRGCPNSCRFCHAGYIYRPYRQKDINDILKEADYLVNSCGYNEITLSSLSSGDYSGLSSLIKILNEYYGGKHVSFSLPSLRINTFTLSLLKELAIIRKSGLTFAVETPDKDWQKIINKEVDLKYIVEILNEAKKLGWKTAKFYFMIGLPVGKKENEEKKIAEFINYVQKSTDMRLNVNVGTFIPKPHTPFQWSEQLTTDESYKKLSWLKEQFKRNGNIKLSYHSPFISFLEGIISRGDERVGDLIYNAYQKGARLDAWTEYFKKDIWIQVLQEADWEVEAEICKSKNPDDKLPWDSIDFGVNKNFIRHEYLKSQKFLNTSVCMNNCKHSCGICDRNIIPRDNLTEIPLDKQLNLSNVNNIHSLNLLKEPVKYIFKFIKTGKAIYLSHKNLINIFQKAFQRSSINLDYSKGFNPKPKLEFAHPLSLGISSLGEIASALIKYELSCENFILMLNKNLPDGISIINCKKMPVYIQGNKKHSLMSKYGGSRYIIKTTEISVQKIKSDLEKYFESKILSINKVLVNLFNIEINKDNSYSKHLILTLPETGTKLSNIMYILKDLYSIDILNKYIDVERIQIFTMENNLLLDFFESL